VDVFAFWTDDFGIIADRGNISIEHPTFHVFLIEQMLPFVHEEVVIFLLFEIGYCSGIIRFIALRADRLQYFGAACVADIY